MVRLIRGRFPTARTFREREHVRLIVSGPAHIVSNVDGESVAEVTVADWEVEPTCRRCGEPV